MIKQNYFFTTVLHHSGLFSGQSLFSNVSGGFLFAGVFNWSACQTNIQVLLRWNIQQGIIPIPKSKNPTCLAENISVFDFELDDNDMQALNSMNQNRRTSHDPLVFDF